MDNLSFFFFSSRRRHTRCSRDWSSDVCSSDLLTTLRKRLDKPISHELKRRIIETLVESVKADTVERWGVQQTQITVTYRFAQPNEAAAAILPLEHHLTNRTRLPEKLETVGDHIRRRRLTIKLLQRQVAAQ